MVFSLNCFDKTLLSFEIGCTGQRMIYSGILYVKGDPDAGRLREAILSTARDHPELMTTLSGGPLRHRRQVHKEVVGEVLEVQDLGTARPQAGQDSPPAARDVFPRNQAQSAASRCRRGMPRRTREDHAAPARHRSSRPA